MNNLASFFLEFSNAKVIIPLLIIGLWFDRKVFCNAICLVLLSVPINIALKTSFGIPLAPSLGKAGFAFPSGHMQASVVLYGWLGLHFGRLWMKLLLLPMLTGIGISLVYFGYHNYYDVLSGIFFGVLLILCYIWVQQKLQQKRINYDR